MSKNTESRVNHDIRSNGGFTVYMPPYAEGMIGWGNLKIPDPNNDIDTSALYPVGSILRGDERAWRYAQIGDIDGDSQTYNIRRGSGLSSLACVNSYTDKLVSETGFNTVGVFKLKVDMTTHINWNSTATSVAVNDYAGGHFTLYTPTSYWGCRIIGNTVEDSDGYVELTLESPLPVTLTSSHILMFEESMWWKVAGSDGNSHSWAMVVGWACNWEQYKLQSSGTGGVTDDDFLWLQTWGPYEGVVFGNPNGAGTNERSGYLVQGYPDEDYYPNMSEHVMPQFGGVYTANNYIGGSPVDFDYNYLTTFFLMIAP